MSWPVRLPSRFGMELKRLPLVSREISVGVLPPQEGIRGFEEKKKSLRIWLIVSKLSFQF